MSEPPPPTKVSLSEFHAAFSRVSNWGRWGEDDDRGTLNLLPTPAIHRPEGTEAARVVSLGRPLSTTPTPSNFFPLLHGTLPDADIQLSDGSAYGHVVEVLAMRPHGQTITHLDALCHFNFNGRSYNDHVGGVSRTGLPDFGTVATMRSGVVGRGVLLDAPGAIGSDWIEPGQPIDAELALATARSQGVEVQPGDIVLVRTGRQARERTLGPWPTRDLSAGCDVSFVEWLRSVDASILGSDGTSEVRPSLVEEIRVPVHILSLVAMGMPLIDNCALEELAEACRERGRWDFAFVMAPLIYDGGSSSPVNPLAIL
jgi:kynurenine formamidase